MPFVGYRSKTDTSLQYQGTYGYYYTSVISSPDTEYARLASIDSSNFTIVSGTLYCATGCSVRLFYDEYIEPDNTRTVEA